jgi:hypothetical protein
VQRDVAEGFLKETVNECVTGPRNLHISLLITLLERAECSEGEYSRFHHRNTSFKLGIHS